MKKTQSWATEEFSKVDFGDKRINNRFLKVASAQASSPQSTINGANNDWSAVKGAYRFFDNDKVTPEKIIEPHIENTTHRIYGQELIIMAQDTTFVDFSTHKMTTGLGNATRLDDTHDIKGIHFHAGLAMSVEGTPLGLLYSKIWSRKKQIKKGHDHTKIPMKSKESYRWVECLEMAKQRTPSGSQLLIVGDRENDIYEYFEKAIDLEVDVLVRLQHNRLISDEFGESERIDEFLLNEKVQGEVEVHIPGNGSRVERFARMEVKFGEIELEGAPRGIKTERVKNRSNIVLTVVQLAEIEKKARGVEALGWTLVTTLPIKTMSDAEQLMKYYRMRWTIELFFKSLKTGCNVEKCRLEEAPKLKKFVALCSVVAWRLMWLTWLQREAPGSTGEVVLTEAEWKTLWLKKHKKQIESGELKADPPNKMADLCTITRWLASFGGFIGRKSDGNPGLITVWRGWQKIQNGAEIYELIGPK